ncbi:hypothetical protein ACJIZ3_024644 [Penstemon smallii]|uniref:EF-hand domain-containing protein n=1 Tax=Penstemon smallii TaxID=265156 RepID=A0ABD3TUM3_9LAMI
MLPPHKIQELHRIFSKLDKNGDGLRAFKVFDLDGDGFISCEELQIALSRLGLWDEHCSGQDCKDMIGMFDTNSDGFVDFEEFKDMVLNDLSIY